MGLRPTEEQTLHSGAAPGDLDLVALGAADPESALPCATPGPSLLDGPSPDDPAPTTVDVGPSLGAEDDGGDLEEVSAEFDLSAPDMGTLENAEPTAVSAAPFEAPSSKRAAEPIAAPRAEPVAEPVAEPFAELAFDDRLPDSAPTESRPMSFPRPDINAAGMKAIPTAVSGAVPKLRAGLRVKESVRGAPPLIVVGVPVEGAPAPSKVPQRAVPTEIMRSRPRSVAGPGEIVEDVPQSEPVRSPFLRRALPYLLPAIALVLAAIAGWSVMGR